MKGTIPKHGFYRVQKMSSFFSMIVHLVVKRTCTSQLSDMLGTQKKTGGLRRPPLQMKVKRVQPGMAGPQRLKRGRSIPTRSGQVLRPYKAKTEEAGLPTESGYIPAAATKTGLALKQNGRPEFKRDARFVFL